MAEVITNQDTLKEYGRGIAGGLLFSLPMLYTLEFWQAGFIFKPYQLLIYLIISFLLLYAYNKYAGFNREDSFKENILESFEEMGMAFLLATFILFITGRIHGDLSLYEIQGKIIIQAVNVAIGISIGKKQLALPDDDSEKAAEKEEKTSASNGYFLQSVNLALCGAILIVSNIAPTDEVPIIAFETKPFKILLIFLFSIGLGAAILNYINFRGSKKSSERKSSIKEIIFGTAIMYSLALSVSFFMLWIFNRFDGVSIYGIIAQVVVLALPASLGASAGRFLIKD